MGMLKAGMIKYAATWLAAALHTSRPTRDSMMYVMLISWTPKCNNPQRLPQFADQL